jgi:hypothetical protein
VVMCSMVKAHRPTTGGGIETLGLGREKI